MSAALALAPHEIAQKCVGSPKEGGVEAQFFKIDKKWGFKFWNDRTLRDMNLIYQTHAAKHNLGPNVGQALDFIHPDDGMQYGFITEICPVLLRCHPHYENISTRYKWRWDERDEENQNNINFPHHGLPDLVTQLSEIGFTDIDDLHDANVGFMPDGRFVCIDFGCFLLA